MAFADNIFHRPFSATGFVARNGAVSIIALGLLHLTAMAVMAWDENSIFTKLVFVLTWGLLNFFWLALLGRAVISAILSLLILLLLVAFSEFKHEVLWIQLSFVDLMIIDTDTVAYLLTIFPWLGVILGVIAAATLPLLALIWWFDPLWVRIRSALAGLAACLLGIVASGSAVELDPSEAFTGINNISYFTRSGVAAVSELVTHGLMESDSVVTDRLKSTLDIPCTPAAKPPHIILVHDESSFDIRSAPGISVPANYGAHFKSFDGKERQFLVEGVGGPSWYAEYSVLTGLSARSFGRFAYFVTRVASGRVLRGLPNVLRRCGYQTRTIFPALGAFMSARSFQTNIGVQQFNDKSDLGARGLEPDKFYYDKALRTLESERGSDPMFLYVYLAANHFPWSYRFRPELLPQWQDLQNPPLIDEYIRRQAMSAQDYQAFMASLKERFPGESFLLFRYGDHQPNFTTEIMEPGLDPILVAQQLMRFNLKYYTTYYAIDTVNFTPADMSSALGTLDGPYLPLVIQEAAGLPLDPSFVEQKHILNRCGGVFYACKAGAEARRFNRLLIDAGLIKRL